MTACAKNLFYFFLKIGEWNIVRKRNEQAIKYKSLQTIKSSLNNRNTHEYIFLGQRTWPAGYNTHIFHNSDYLQLDAFNIFFILSNIRNIWITNAEKSMTIIAQLLNGHLLIPSENIESESLKFLLESLHFYLVNILDWKVAFLLMIL